MAPTTTNWTPKYRNYRVKLNPATGLPIETRLYTFWKLEGFLGPDFDEDDWSHLVSDRYCRTRAIILYALRECERDDVEQRLRRSHLINICNKYAKAQPKYWPRFLREKYPRWLRINASDSRKIDFFNCSYDDTRDWFYSYERLLGDAEADPNETGKIFDFDGAMTKLRAEVEKIDVRMSQPSRSSPHLRQR